MRNVVSDLARRLAPHRDTLSSARRPSVVYREDEYVQSASRRVPLSLAAAAVTVVLLLLVLVVSSLDSTPGGHPTPAAKQGTGTDQPWWAGLDETARPSSSTSPSPQASSDTYLIVGPETPPSSPASAPASGSKPANPAPKRPAAATFTAVTGDACQHDDSRGYQVIGRYTDGDRGWYGRSSGGWTGDGCSGAFDALPMSGFRDRDDTSAFVVWWFRPTNVRQGSCAISVYIPTGREYEDVAGRPAFYNVIGGKDDYRRTSGFKIDQVANRGRWINAGSYPLRNGQIGVQMVTRGEDPNNEHLAAAQVKAACRAA